MGTREFRMLLEYAVPLMVKLLFNGKDEKEAVEAATSAIKGLENGVPEVMDVMLEASPEKKKSIIDGLFGVITGAADALGGLIKAFVSLLFK